MSIDTFKERWPENVPGPFYISSSCIDCGHCISIAPGVFARSEAGAYSYVARQPPPRDIKAVQRAIEECPTDAIHADGERFNWALIRPRAAPGK